MTSASSTTTQTLFEQAQAFATNNPWATGVGIMLIGAGVTGALYKMVRHQPAKSPSAAEQLSAAKEKQIKEVLDRLLIKEYYLPKKMNERSTWALSNPPQAIFNEKTRREIAIVAKMIEKAVKHQSPLPNLILKGPAGVGKTMLGEALCHQTGIGFIRIPSGAMEKHLKTGNHIVAFRDVVKLAEECPAPTYIIMDDGEELVAQRPETKKTDENNTTKAPWLVEQERLSETIAQRRTALVNAILEESGKAYRKVGFCITTNRPHVVDSAFGTRSRVISIEIPDLEERKQIIITHLPHVFKFDKDMLSFFNKGRLEDMAIKTEGFTGRNIVKMLEDVYACVQLENGNITQDAIDASILAMKASVEHSEGKRGSVKEALKHLGRSLVSYLS